jgi:hypothetical protein
MNVSRRLALSPVLAIAALAVAFLPVAIPCMAEDPAAPQAPASMGASDPSRPASVCSPSLLDSPYIPVDNWIYPAVWRLYSLGFVDSVFLGIRPYTRSSLDHMLEEAGARIEDADPGPATDEAEGIYESLSHELHFDVQGPCGRHQGATRVESIYSVERAISGTPLRDSYHLGSTVINDYGRPYESGFNDYSGASGYASAGRFQLYVRGEFQAAPSGAGYSTALAQYLATTTDNTGVYFNPTCWRDGNAGPACVALPVNLLTTIPLGPIAAATKGRILEAYVSAHYLNHEISFGKQDEWLGSAMGGAMAYSNNAENIYAFQINRIEPLHVPLLSYVTGPFRYEFLVGPLKGHIFPRDPWVHVEKVSFKPTPNLEFGFERTVIWGGKGHEPITLHTFLKSFISLSAPNALVKDSRGDPGARFGAFDFNYRLPFVRNWLTIYADSEVHDDVSPIDAPRRAAYRPGIYLSHFPGVPKLDLRVEAASTDPTSSNAASNNGQFMYYEAIQKQGYTNNGQMFGDWIGREAKGGQAWITWHLSGNELVQVSVRNQKNTPSFIPGGTTLNDINFKVVKRIGKDLEVNGNFAYEHWNAPIYNTGTPTYPAPTQSVTTTTIQLTWFPKNKLTF